MYKIIVLCPKESNRSDRWDFKKPNIIRELGYWKNDEVLKDELHKYQFMPTANIRIKMPRIAVMEGHINILQKIVNEKLSNVFVLEDDAIIANDDLIEKFLKDVETINGLVYVGGIFNYSKIKDWSNRKPPIKKYMEGKSIKGLNKIGSDLWVCGCFGYFIKDYSIAKIILDNCKGTTGKYISSLCDVMLNKVKNLDKYYYYPSLVECSVETDTIIGLGNPHYGKSFKNYIY